VDVDWGGIFKFFYEVVRVKLAVKDSTKIPEKRIVVMRKKFYQLLFEVERASSSAGNIQHPPSPPHDDGGGDDADFDDDEDDLLDNDGLEEGGRENADRTPQGNGQTSSTSSTYKRVTGTKTHVVEEGQEKEQPESGNRFQVLIDMGMMESDDEDQIIPNIEVDEITGTLEDVVLSADEGEQNVEMSRREDEKDMGQEVNQQTDTGVEDASDETDAVQEPTPAEACKAMKRKNNNWGHCKLQGRVPA
jgi:hypothetical protein